MTRSVGVLCAVQGPDEVAFVQELEALAPAVVLARRCGDLAELLAAAHAGLGRVAVVSGDLPGLDRDAVAALRSAEVRIVAVVDPPEGWLADRTRALGIDVVAAPAGAVEAVSSVAQRVLAGDDDASSGGGGRARAGVAGRPDGRHWSSELLGGADDGVAHSRPRVGEAADAGEGTHGAEADAAPSVESDAGTDGARRRGRRSVTEGAEGGDRANDPLRAREVADPFEPTAVPGPTSGAVIAVWGPTGAPGRTTLAVNLAAELAGAGSGGVTLVDADTYGGTVAQALGMLDEAPGIAAAARAAGQGTLDRSAFALLAPVVSEGLRVVSGISRASRWAELPGPSLDVVWDVARTVAEWTVVDCGFGVEDDEALSYDTRAPRRNAATLSALAAADLVVVVGAADPIGVQRLVRALGDLDALGLPGSRVVVANRVRVSAVGPRPGDLIAAALERYAGVSELRLVPDDRAALDAAVLRGVALREIAAGSPARKAIASLAQDLLEVRGHARSGAGGAAAAGRRRGRRRAASGS